MWVFGGFLACWQRCKIEIIKRSTSPKMEQVKENTGALPREMSADAGYFSSDAVKDLSAEGMDVYMPPDRMHHTYKMPAAPRGRIPSSPIDSGPDETQAEDEAGTEALRAEEGVI
jgi:hypothetical protein